MRKADVMTNMKEETDIFRHYINISILDILVSYFRKSRTHSCMSHKCWLRNNRLMSLPFLFLFSFSFYFILFHLCVDINVIKYSRSTSLLLAFRPFRMLSTSSSSHFPKSSRLDNFFRAVLSALQVACQ